MLFYFCDDTKTAYIPSLCYGTWVCVCNLLDQFKLSNHKCIAVINVILVVLALRLLSSS